MPCLKSPDNGLSVFSRRCLSAGFAACTTLSLTASIVFGQTFEEAVRANVSLATTLCADAMLSGSPARVVFGNSGFVYRAIDRGTNEYGVALGLDHYFEAPADTAKAEVMAPDGHPGLCQVMTPHLIAADVSDLVTGVLRQRYPGTEVRGADEWIVSGVSDLPLMVTLRTISTNHRYEAPGTVQVTMGFPG